MSAIRVVIILLKDVEELWRQAHDSRAADRNVSKRAIENKHWQLTLSFRLDQIADPLELKANRHMQQCLHRLVACSLRY